MTSDVLLNFFCSITMRGCCSGLGSTNQRCEHSSGPLHCSPSSTRAQWQRERCSPAVGASRSSQQTNIQLYLDLGKPKKALALLREAQGVVRNLKVLLFAYVCLWHREILAAITRLLPGGANCRSSPPRRR